MAGLIEKKMAGAPAKGGLTVTPESVMQGLHLQPQQQEPLQRIVAGGMKVMFDQKTHDLVQQQLAGPGDVPTKMGEGVAKLMLMLMQEASGALPGNLLIPAGMVLVAHAAKFMQDTGVAVTDQDVAAAMSVMVGALLQAAGMSPQAIEEAGGRAAGEGESAADEAAEDPAEEATETPDQEAAEQPPSDDPGDHEFRG